MTHPKLSATQTHAMWAVYRAGRLTTLNQWDYVADTGRVRGQTVNGLAHRRLITAVSLPSWKVSTPERVYSGVSQWEATLTREGEEWIAREFVRTEGLPSQGTRTTV